MRVLMLLMPLLWMNVSDFIVPFLPLWWFGGGRYYSLCFVIVLGFGRVQNTNLCYPAPSSAPWRMDGKWFGNSFPLGSGSLANHSNCQNSTKKKKRRLKSAKFVYLVSISSQKLSKNDQRIALHGWCIAKFGLKSSNGWWSNWSAASAAS